MSITAEKVAAEICLSKGDRPCEADDLHRDGIRTQHCAHCQSTARAILSLLQQGEPEGFRSLVYDYLELRGIPHQEEWVDGGETFQKALAAHGKLLTMLSASPLPPAPGAETGGELIECKRCRGWGNLGMGGRDGTCPDCGGDGKIKAEQPSSSRQAVLEESGPELLARLGTDAGKWAAEFRKVAISLGYSDMDEGWLIGWFANAMMNEHDKLIRATTPPAEGEGK